VRGPRERKLRVVIDSNTVEECEALDVLVGFGWHDDVDVIETEASDGIGRLSIGLPDAANDLVHVEATLRTTESGRLSFRTSGARRLPARTRDQRRRRSIVCSWVGRRRVSMRTP